VGRSGSPGDILDLIDRTVVWGDTETEDSLGSLVVQGNLGPALARNTGSLGGRGRGRGRRGTFK